LADFDNPAGLEKVGSNMFINTNNSGTPKYGQPSTGSFGALNPGALEMSNVDLSKEFTEMITTQRGFQANSRVISTSDEILQELVNLKR
jgi:flagellar hook protein FlgE